GAVSAVVGGVSLEFRTKRRTKSGALTGCSAIAGTGAVPVLRSAAGLLRSGSLAIASRSAPP
ncbi:MAG: hypothetical protein WD079_07845, partial [Phycisphaeraceae bacterium]